MFSTYLKKIAKKHSNNKSNITWNTAFLPYQDQEKAGIESYKNNNIVHRCVSLIAISASHVPWQIYKNYDNHKQIIHDHQAHELLKTPSPDKSGADFFTESISNLLLYGETYILSVQANNNTPSELYNLHPQIIEHVKSNNCLVAYKYKLHNNEQIYPIDPITRMSHVLHIKNYNPSSSDHGLSSLSAASKSIQLYSKIMDWNKSLLQNATRPSGALVFQDGNGYLTNEQFERLQQQFYDNFSGSSNSGKPLILEGGLKWQETSHAERFEKFIELKDSSARDIAIAFNVPPQLLGISGDNTYSNMQEARLSLWEENIIPLLDKYSDALSNWLSYCYDEELIVEFDKESISVLTKRRENLWSKISNSDFMTINEKRAFVGLGRLNNGDCLSTKN